MTTRKIIAATVLLGSAFIASNAAAEEPQRSGVSVTAGGGIEEFTLHTMRHTSNLNGAWGVRAAVEVQRYFQLEAGYLGSAGKINAPLGNTSATLVGTAFEAVGRITPLPGARLQPYAVFGAGWRHYAVAGEAFTTADAGMNDADDLFQMPVGAGVAYRYGAFLADARLMYRVTTGESLVLEEDGGYAAMDTWGLTGALGYEF